ncbi:hypothetical protein BD310DRAFT_1004654 [Dichomitus squalens]|uniref:Uncharacterized protein n=1 Tax=Dichomitus squalens TaxID=114155 RepID=A0A4Q9Q0H4_9APHY|nr:hypothetical protein BD310DRAFT_1004654 [Dichomitus squalens]
MGRPRPALCQRTQRTELGPSEESRYQIGPRGCTTVRFNSKTFVHGPRPSSRESLKSFHNMNAPSSPASTTASASTAVVEQVPPSLDPGASPDRHEEEEIRDEKEFTDEEEISDGIKLPMRHFEWGGNVIRKRLPIPSLPLWLSPTFVGIDDPRKLPLCWYGYHFLPHRIYKSAERIGLGAYLRENCLRLKAGDLHASQT